MNARVLVPVLLTMGALTDSTVRAQDPLDIWVGQAGGKVAWSPAGFHPGSRYNPLFRVDTFLHGWSNANPGFDRATQTAGGVFPIALGTAAISLEVVALDPALVAFGPLLQYELNSPGDRGPLGDDMHEHFTWFIDEEDPLYDQDQCAWAGTFRLVATSGGLGPSQPFTLLFANVPVRGGEFPPTPTAANGDWDGDHDVDGDDYTAFVVCLDGPERRPSPDIPSVTTCEVDCYNAFDFDDDLDIDLTDFAAFQGEYSP